MHVEGYAHGENDRTSKSQFEFIMRRKIQRRWLLWVVSVLTVIVALITWAGFTHAIIVEPGHHAVLVDKPMIFGSGGVRAEPLKEGRKLVWDTTSHVMVRMQPQSFSVKFDDLMSADNIPLDFESSIQYRILDAVKLVDKYGIEYWFTNNVEPQYRTIVRRAVKKYSMTDIISNAATAAAIDEEVTAGLLQLIKDSGLPVQLDGVSLGRATPNENVLLQMNETAAQQQRKKTLIEAEAAEIQREKEQTAKAAADNAYRNKMQLSPEQFVQLEAIKRFAEACAKGNTCVISTSGAGAPVLVNPQK